MDEVKAGSSKIGEYRRGVGIMLLNKEGQIFVGQRLDVRTEAWQMPQGGIEEGEEPREAVFRELKEEVGVDQVEIIAETPKWLRYELPKELVPKVWGGAYVGQEQKWYLMRFLGDDSQINIQTQVPEFHAWKWVSLEELHKTIVCFKVALYKELVDIFAPYVHQ
ncbi:MAG: RNA pyrophosphohydrolase [Alphaproteobacteria bacterium]|jgi:putative (di)nucleoside polyphosphate hydrolase|nr:RNA pyrophosphohydrolase [Alphaproteobacteria bacterium]MBT5389621.1 RNA pyrophosphohydrolase [Alphaproteobacteria bacterium]MBT5540718.1 RNA pyrophosphohydrolase [Alphaproteobacteria bacterium]MBT5654573.1 RNA pyrophosphohydrolase [Alphaproteobacteria bacterium]